jgi:hypothetical protein
MMTINRPAEATPAVASENADPIIGKTTDARDTDNEAIPMDLSPIIRQAKSSPNTGDLKPAAVNQNKTLLSNSSTRFVMKVHSPASKATFR